MFASFPGFEPGTERQKESKVSAKTTEPQCHSISGYQDYVDRLVVGGGDDNHVPCEIAWNQSHVR